MRYCNSHTRALREELYIKQGGKCAICGCREMGTTFALDHNHKTGEIRGLLCGLCNRSLGNFKDSVETLRRAIEYLEAGVAY